MRFLAGFDAPLALRDSEGHTPLYYAKQQRSGVMRKVLEELLPEEEARKVRFHPISFFFLFCFVLFLFLFLFSFIYILCG